MEPFIRDKHYTLDPVPLPFSSLSSSSVRTYVMFFLSAEFLFLWIIELCVLFTFCLAFPRLQGPSQSRKKTVMHSILFTTRVLSPSCSYHLLPLVSPPARRVCGLRLCAAHDQTMTRNFASSASSVFVVASGSLFSWALVFGYFCSYFVAFHCVGLL